MDRKSLVIYFSHTGENYMSDGIRNIDKGNTEVVAEFIKDITNADLFRVQPIKKYPYSYKECCDVAKQELNENKRPNLVNYLDNIDDYDIIYIGTPVWWGYPPMAMYTQLEKLNFDGKIIMPFTTHEGSGLGNCVSEIKKICNNADVKDGCAIYGSNVYNSKNEIENWINTVL